MLICIERTKIIFLLACLLVISGLSITDTSGQSLTEVGILPSVPRDFPALASLPTSSKTNVLLARNEEEMIFLRLQGTEKLAWDINIRGGELGLTSEFFEVLRVPVKSDKLFGGSDWVFDPMIPLVTGQIPSGSDQPRFILVKVKATSSATPGVHTLTLIIAQKGGSKYSLNLSVNISQIVLPEEMPVKVQAAVWPPSKWYISHFDSTNPQVKAEATIVELIRILRRYRINALSRLWQGTINEDMTWHEKDVTAFHRIVNVALDDLGYQLIRLPNPVFFRGMKPFAKVYGFDSSGLERWTTDTERFLCQFSDLMKVPRWKGHFAYEIWDEPGKKQMPQVNALYKLFGDKFPGIARELTREPYAGEGLDDVADIWAIGMTKFKSRYTHDIQQRGDEVWLYANQWHGVDRHVSDPRAIGWALWKYNLNGYLLWGINRWAGDPWTTVSEKKTDMFKRAAFVYPHPITGEIVPSLRLEFLREGMEDMLLLRAAEKQLPAALAAELQAVFPQDRPRYKNQLPDFGQLHNKLLKELGVHSGPLSLPVHDP